MRWLLAAAAVLVACGGDAWETCTSASGEDVECQLADSHAVACGSGSCTPGGGGRWSCRFVGIEDMDTRCEKTAAAFVCPGPIGTCERP